MSPKSKTSERSSREFSKSKSPSSMDDSDSDDEEEKLRKKERSPRKETLKRKAEVIK
jgi:hypothetical protein